MQRGSEPLKKSFPTLKKRYGKRTYFEDEMRSGTRSQSKRRWPPQGHRPLCQVKLGYEFTYLYCALAPATGALIALMLPEMTRACFEVFVDHFQKQTRQLHGHHPVVLIADKAGSHQREVCAQRRIALQHLPRGCPELNPVERFFEELRKELADHLFDNLRQVEDYLARILKKYWQHPELIIKLCHYPYMRTT
ncbi:transposase [Chitinophagaceae bacterium LB-8]|uniref:Transposase n=2 Tax=Paraflavisolibacter caeni TaxID=2982496 RepID=A0A9X2XN79_9BACT|nr:transposase [Paraflavisolibacter caeni]MCU7547724.1 transposase [Paraflavisolibacter caeni]